MRISKEIVAFASGKDAAFQPERPAARSPGVTEAARDLLQRRAVVLPVVEGQHACHSDRAPDAGAAQALQATVVNEPTAPEPR